MKSFSLFFIVFILLFSYNVSSQSIWLNDQNGFFTLEYAKPSLKGESGIKFLSGTYDLSIGSRLGNKFMLIGDVPITHFNSDYTNSETSIGNIFIGGRIGDAEKPAKFEIGAFLPTGNGDNIYALSYGALSYPNRMEKFIPDTWTLSTRLRIDDTFNDPKFFYRFMTGVAFIFFDDSNTTDQVFFMDFAGQVGIRSEDNLTVRVGLDGRVGLNDSAKFNGDDATSILGGMGISYRVNNFEPGIELKFPLDKPYKDLIGNIFSLTLLYHFND